MSALTRRSSFGLGLRHLTLVLISFAMLVPFYWVIKTAVTNENIYAYPPSVIPRDPHLFNFVDVWYLIPFPRYLLNSIVVSAIAVLGNVVFNAMAGYALTRQFPGHVPPIKPGCRADLRPNLTSRDKDSGRPAMILSVDTLEATNGVAEAIGRWYAGPAVSGFYTFELKKSGGVRMACGNSLSGCYALGPRLSSARC